MNARITNYTCCVVKDSPFPGLEPTRLYLLRSSANTVKAPKDIGHSRDKWVKTPFETDSRPRRGEKGPLEVPNSVPEMASRPVPDQGTAQPLAQPALGTYCGTCHLSRCFPSGDVSNVEFEKLLILNITVSTVSTATGLSYTTLERLMEGKARALGGLGLRREFFRFLQKMRDQVRQCSIFSTAELTKLGKIPT